MCDAKAGQTGHIYETVRVNDEFTLEPTSAQEAGYCDWTMVGQDGPGIGFMSLVSKGRDKTVHEISLSKYPHMSASMTLRVKGIRMAVPEVVEDGERKIIYFGGLRVWLDFQGVRRGRRQYEAVFWNDTTGDIWGQARVLGGKV